MFNDIEKLNTPEGWNALMYCIKHDVCISGEIANFLIEECDQYIVDEGYVDFEDSFRWTISKYYIFNFDEDYYRLWQECGLTEMQSNECWDQTLEKVSARKISITAWMTDEEADSCDSLDD